MSFVTKWFRKRLTSPQLFKDVPEAGTIMNEIFKRTQARYDLLEAFERVDPDLQSAIALKSALVQSAYKGPVVRVGKEITDREKLILKTCQNIDEDLNIRSWVYTATRSLIRDGDLVVVMNMNESGINELIPLPMSLSTAVEKTSEIGQASLTYYLRKPIIYVYAEGDTTSQETWPKDECLHFSIDPNAQVIADNKGRETLGIWSQSPVYSLKADELWKLSSKINDMLWRRRHLPKVHYKLDLSAFTPDQASGSTAAEKTQNAKTAAQAEIESFAASISDQQADQAIITGKDTDADILEPKSTTYSSPNDLLDQLNKSIFRSTGVQEVLERQSSYASGLIGASYTAISAESIGLVIRTQLIKLFRTHVKKVIKDITNDELRDIDVKFQLILLRDREEFVRQIAILYSTNSWTRTELRAMLGDAPLTDDQISDLPNPKGDSSGRGERTIGDVVSGYVTRSGPNYPTTPESQHDQQVT